VGFARAHGAIEIALRRRFDNVFDRQTTNPGVAAQISRKEAKPVAGPLNSGDQVTCLL
jgi:hypothetical protein